jgi:hypothetical protein
MDSIVSKFGLSPYEFAGLLRCYNGYMMGGSVLSAWLGRPLEEAQDLDVFVPLPVPLNGGTYTIAKRSSDGMLSEAGMRWSTWAFVEAIRRNFESFLTSRGYVAAAANGSDEYYGTRHFNTVIYYVRSFNRAVDGVVQKIQIVYTRDITAAENAARVDFDCCQFYAAPSELYMDSEGNFFPITSIHDDSHDRSIRDGVARVLYKLEDLTEFERRKMDARLCKYMKRGFMFHDCDRKLVLPLPPMSDRSALIKIPSAIEGARDIIKVLLEHNFLFEGVPSGTIYGTVAHLNNNPTFIDAPWVFTFKFMWWKEDRRITFNLVKAEIV